MTAPQTLTKIFRAALLLTLPVTLLSMMPERATAQQQAKAKPSPQSTSVRQQKRSQKNQPGTSSSAMASSPQTAPDAATKPASGSLGRSVDPFTEFEQAAKTGKVFDINFGRTDLDKKAEGTAQAIMRGQTLLVRVTARNMPLPSYFNVPRYSLWVYVPNYQIKMYIGDLPITLGSNSGRSRPAGSGGNASVQRGTSESAYSFPNLPPGAVFGGLAVTAEPARYTAIINEALRPVLVGLLPDQQLAEMVSAVTLYSGPVPESILNKRGEQPVPTQRPNN